MSGRFSGVLGVLVAPSADRPYRPFQTQAVVIEEHSVVVSFKLREVC